MKLLYVKAAIVSAALIALTLSIVLLCELGDSKRIRNTEELQLSEQPRETQDMRTANPEQVPTVFSGLLEQPYGEKPMEPWPAKAISLADALDDRLEHFEEKRLRMASALQVQIELLSSAGLAERAEEISIESGLAPRLEGVFSKLNVELESIHRELKALPREEWPDRYEGILSKADPHLDQADDLFHEEEELLSKLDALYREHLDVLREQACKRQQNIQRREDQEAIALTIFKLAYPYGVVNWTTMNEGDDLVSFEYSLVNAFGTRVQRKFTLWFKDGIPTGDFSDEFLYFKEKKRLF